MDWSLLETRSSLFGSSKQLIAFRHHYRFYAAICFDRAACRGFPFEDVTWINANGRPMEEHHWTDGDPLFWDVIGRPGSDSRTRQQRKDVTVLVLINVS